MAEALNPSTRKVSFGAFSVSLAVHIGLLLMISSVVIYQKTAPKVPFVGENMEEAALEVAPPEILEEPAAPPSLDVEAGPPAPSSNALPSVQAPTEYMASVIQSSAPAMNFSLPSAGAVGNSASIGKLGTMGGGTGGSFQGIGGSFFGSTTASANEGMAGAYFDLRRDAQDRVDPEWARLSAVNDAEKGGWGGVFGTAYLRFCEKLFDGSGKPSQAKLDNYYRPPQQVASYFILMPKLPSDSAAAAFGVNRTEGRQAWLVNYHAKLKFDGRRRFRFVGGADEILVVRVNGRLVLDGTWSRIPWLTGNRNPTDWKPEGIVEGPFSDNWKMGDWFTVDGPFELEITVGEGWGGFFSGVLAIEEEGKNYEGQPRPLFKIDGYQKMLSLIEPVVAAQSRFITLEGPTFHPVR